VNSVVVAYQQQMNVEVDAEIFAVFCDRCADVQMKLNVLMMMTLNFWVVKLYLIQEGYHSHKGICRPFFSQKNSLE
jgi:hypothetical protein